MYRRSRVMPVEGRALTSGVLVKKQGKVIGDEPGNTIQDPDASEKPVSQSEGRAGLPLLSVWMSRYSSFGLGQPRRAPVRGVAGGPEPS
jgi:hypothetical protein